VARQYEETAAAQELVLTARNDLRTTFAGLIGFVLVVFALEAGRDGPLAQHDVERLLDVVGVELLVEVDDVVFLFLLDVGAGARLDLFDDGAGQRDDDHRLVLDDSFDFVVVLEVVADQLFVEVLFERVLVEFLFVELGLVLELVVTHRARGPRGR